MNRENHTLKPIYDKDSRVLILGSFPSPMSRSIGFYYGNPKNRFWQVITNVFDSDYITHNDEKISFLLEKRIALWDVLESCEIDGAKDLSIKKEIANNLDLIYNFANIKMTFLTGKTAEKYFVKYFDKPYILLPSTSPANCAVGLEELINRYKIIKNYL